MKAEWQPIETYDKLRRKPLKCVFYVAPENLGRSKHSETYSFSRVFGFRTVTHWMELPPSPTEQPQTQTV